MGVCSKRARSHSALVHSKALATALNRRSLLHSKGARYVNMRLHSGVANRGSDSCTHSRVCRSCIHTSFSAQPAPAGTAGGGGRHQSSGQHPRPPTEHTRAAASTARPAGSAPHRESAWPAAPPSPPKISSWSEGPRLPFICTCAQEKRKRGSGDRPRTGSWRHVRVCRSNSQRSPMGRDTAAAPGAPACRQGEAGALSARGGHGQAGRLAAQRNVKWGPRSTRPQPNSPPYLPPNTKSWSPTSVPPA